MNMVQIIQQLLMKNRTIVTKDVSECMSILKTVYPLKIHSYPSGEEYQTWPIPLEWNVKKATLSHNNKILADYSQNPLFLAPYSQSFKGKVSKQELTEHTYTNEQKPDCFLYEFRLAYNFQRRLKEWRITLPFNLLKSLPENEHFDIDIEVETKPGQMMIGENIVNGQSGYLFTFLAHYCHVAQANDGLAGVAIMLEVIERIRKKYATPKHSYKALAMPETIGSSVYAANNLAELDNTLGAVFSEMGGADQDLQMVFSRRGDSYIDRVFLHVLKQRKVPVRYIPFRKGWGNDELVFDSPGVGVPVVSLDRHPFEAYHTNLDNMDLIVENRLEEVVSILMDVVDILEKDFVPKPKNRVPVYLTRFNLYSDWTFERNQYDVNTQILDGLWSGLSVFDIAYTHDIALDYVFKYLSKFFDNGLLACDPITPAYTRSQRFLTKHA